MTPMRVLIIDDDSALRQALRGALEEEKGTWEVEDRGFDGLGETLARFRPDMIVLDLVEGQIPGEQDTGNTSFEQIREMWFCPVVVYSAFPGRQRFDHPLVDGIAKGANTEEKVRDRLKAYRREASMIRDVHRDFDARIRFALRDSVHALRVQLEETTDGSADSVLPRAVRRLVAARADAGASEQGRLRAWERYVVPPLGRHLLTADLLRQADADWTKEEAFRLVLTPSCDLVPGRGELTDAEGILVARCEPLARLGRIEPTPGKSLTNTQKNGLRPILTEGMAGNHLAIPEFRGHVPLMVADLKRLELLERDRVRLEPSDGTAAGDGVFRRVASTDSPFREMVVWAYLRVSGRPGVPEIHVEEWLEDISRHFKARQKP